MNEHAGPSARPSFCSALLAWLLFLVAGCAQDPTEVVVTVFSDLPCGTSTVAAVAIGVPGELGDRSVSGTSTTCNADGSRGVVVLVPKGRSDAEFAVEVRISADRSVSIDDCVAANGYRNCIVARRILSFLPERAVHLRVDLRNPCISTACSQRTTCVAQGTSKSCLEAQIDVNKCAGECDEKTVIVQHPKSVIVPDGPSEACAVNPCDANGTCHVVAGEATCTCQAGYEHVAVGDPFCTDIDECQSDALNDCGPHATCSNEAGGFSCSCDEGYAGRDGKACQQVECSEACAVNGACVKGSAAQFACQCDPGFEGDGLICVDRDECAASPAPCASTATCMNTPGGFRCTCLPGYEGDGKTCTDRDECAATVAPCAPEAHCVNVPGSFTCSCGDGYTGDGTTCADVDECLNPASCDPHATCVNLSGSFRCECVKGYTDIAGVCIDDDECSAGPACAASETCTNTPGSFTCQCIQTNQVPTMTSNTLPSGVASSSGNISTGYPPWQAFDGLSSMWISQTYVVPAQLTYEFASATPRILAYEILFANGSSLLTRGPRDWTLQGSNDAGNTGWVTLDQRVGISWPMSMAQRFSVTNPGAYRKYRLNVTDDNDPAPGIIVISIAEFRLFPCAQ